MTQYDQTTPPKEQRPFPPRVWISKKAFWEKEIQHGQYAYAYWTAKHPDTETEYLSLTEAQSLAQRAAEEARADERRKVLGRVQYRLDGVKAEMDLEFGGLQAARPAVDARREARGRKKEEGEA